MMGTEAVFQHAVQLGAAALGRDLCDLGLVEHEMYAAVWQGAELAEEQRWGSVLFQCARKAKFFSLHVCLAMHLFHFSLLCVNSAPSSTTKLQNL